jgi:hypothetical protein
VLHAGRHTGHRELSALPINVWRNLLAFIRPRGSLFDLTPVPADQPGAWWTSDGERICQEERQRQEGHAQSQSDQDPDASVKLVMLCDSAIAHAAMAYLVQPTSYVTDGSDGDDAALSASKTKAKASTVALEYGERLLRLDGVVVKLMAWVAPVDAKLVPRRAGASGRSRADKETKRERENRVASKREKRTAKNKFAGRLDTRGMMGLLLLFDVGRSVRASQRPPTPSQRRRLSVPSAVAAACRSLTPLARCSARSFRCALLCAWFRPARASSRLCAAP